MNHPSHPSSVQKLLISQFSAELRFLESYFYFPTLSYVPYEDQSSRQHKAVGQLSQGGGVGDIYQNNMNYFICFAPQRFFTVHTVDNERYCIIQRVCEISIEYVQRTCTIGILVYIRYIVLDSVLYIGADFKISILSHVQYDPRVPRCVLPKFLHVFCSSLKEDWLFLYLYSNVFFSCPIYWYFSFVLVTSALNQGANHHQGSD